MTSKLHTNKPIDRYFWVKSKSTREKDIVWNAANMKGNVYYLFGTEAPIDQEEFDERYTIVAELKIDDTK